MEAQMNESTYPIISIITIFRNEERHISATLRSILDQRFRSFECILVDGHSSDSSIDIINRLVGNDNRFVLVTQETKGISNAFNEGMARARGRSMLFLNGGDLLADECALERMAQAFEANPQLIHCFRGRYIDEQGKALPKFLPTSERFSEKSLLWSCDVCHQATLVPSSIIRSLGGYSPSFRIAMDYDLWLRAFAKGVSFKGHPEVVALHRTGGISGQMLGLSRLEVVSARLLNLGLKRMSILKDLVQLALVAKDNSRGALKRLGLGGHEA